ncbi:UDP-N-acetylmuramoyl-L-alanyl-D-glutamate--2,6-diaminopimelate ligase [Kineococcus sp. NUM-3379]
MPTSDPISDGPRGTRPTGAPTVADLVALLGPDASAEVPPGAAAAVVTGATLDSRAVRPGDLYAALPGARAHGADFAAQAAAAGAVAALTDPAGRERVRAAGLPAVVVPDPRAVLGGLAAAVHGHPAAALTTVGITGTNGKTTTAYLLEALFAAAGWSTGLIGTVEIRIGSERLSSVRTTPEAPDLHALFARMRDGGVRACAMEVSSHALRLHRVDGAVLDVAVFTNLSQDHLDFHRDMEDYFAAKAELFTPQHSRRGVVAVDDGWGRRLARTAGVPVTTVRTAPAEDLPAGAAPAADWAVADVVAGRHGSTFTLTGPDGLRLALACPLPGAFNVSNTALAAVAALVAGVPADAVTRGSATAGGVPGRMQAVATGAAGEPVAVVDFAHSPDALERVLQTLRQGTPGRLVVVLGAGGDRDPAKRGAMGAVAAAGADVVVVTDDNPRSEDPAAVRAAVLAGAAAAGTGARVLEVPGRREAIAAGLTACTGPGDTLLVAGKGHERGQEVAGRVLPFDDAEVTAALLRERAAPADPSPHTLRGGQQ